jgi:arylamine N-acetyltransferase
MDYFVKEWVISNKKNEGGLCFQLNPLLYFFLVENGFHAVLVRGVVYNNATKEWPNTGRLMSQFFCTMKVNRTWLILDLAGIYP